MDERLKTLIAWIKKSTRRANGVLVPVSGGSDSALIFWLFNQACPEKTLGVFSGSNLRCREWFESVGTIRRIPAPARQGGQGSSSLGYLLFNRNRREQVDGWLQKPF